MEKTIVQYLNNDKELINLIGEDRIFPLFTTDISKPSLVYSIREISENDIKRAQLEVKVIWNDLEKVINIRERVKKILHFNKNRKSENIDNIVFRGSLTGGGPYFNTQIKYYEYSLNFIIKYYEK